MLDKFIALFDEDNCFKEVWELKLIQFDIDLDEEVKPYEKYLAISHIVEDTKGNPGIRGHFYVTNLRYVWHAANDRDLNMSIGIDTINNVSIRTSPYSTSQSKHLMVVKTQSPSGNKYQFKFSIFSEKEIDVFNKAIEIYKEAVGTKLYRSIDTNLLIDYQNRKFLALDKEEIFNTYPESKYYQDQKMFDCDLVLTNIRLVIMMENPHRGISYGIPWIMIQSYSKINLWGSDAFELKIRGILSEKIICIKNFKTWPKFSAEFNSLATAFRKNPLLGIDTSRFLLKHESRTQSKTATQEKDQQQTFQTKINIKRTRNTYSTQSSQGSLADTFFNEELGLMMQTLPEGTSRSSLWEILS